MLLCKNISHTAVDSLQFTYKDKVIQPEDTPASLNMNSDDTTIQVSLTGDALTKEQIANACTSGSISTAIDLLSKNKEICNQSITWFDLEGQELSSPPLFICIDYGHVELVEKLLPLHEDILSTLTGGDGDYTALQWASWTGHLEIVKLLIEKGKAKADEEAISLAREDEHNEVVDYLLKYVDIYASLDGDADEIMTKACREGDSKKVRQLLEEENYDIEKWKDDEGKYLAFSPMYLAVKNGHMEVIQVFSEKGVTIQDLDVVPEVSTE